MDKYSYPFIKYFNHLSYHSLGVGVKVSIDRSIYAVKPFKDYGYRRLKCKVCGEYFWSVIERDNCGDAPCTDYTFFDIKLKVGPLTVTEVRNRFLEFFRRRGHEVIEPHPVLARWRDDLYLTIASIIVFQPHVTSGLVPPPANPLVIAQPCIRLEDIDSVGYTFGRHLTNFIMGGHHAFNYPNKYVYFTDETVEYAREFFIKELGVPEDEITFKESWWEGGGNAGPSFEVAIGGLEVATLVFMMYEVKDGQYVEMPLKIVDTGYGIERIAWLTQKTPTAFHAIYGQLVPEYFKILELEEPPKEVFRELIKYVGRLNPKTPELYDKLKQLVMHDMGLDSRLISEYLDNSIYVFTLLDHIKTALLMLSDGAVPSNTGEGYLVRLVLRRVFRLLHRLRKVDVLEELIKKQISYWNELYPKLAKMRFYILDAVNNELKKYEQVLNRAPQVVSKYLRRRGSSLGTLIELYDSHGIPPEIVSDVANKLGMNVKVPSNFYSILASRHSRAPLKPKEKVKVPKEVIEYVRKLPKTKLIFHEDPYVREFEAKVVKVLGKYIILDKTAFYPEGGGQLYDTGYIILPNGLKLKVVNVQKVGNVVVHEVENSPPTGLESTVVKGVIDWDRRYTLMRHHTATHIILGVVRLLLGDHVWQAGAEKTEYHGRLDITHYKMLSEEEVRRIEALANKIVNEGRKVRTYYLP
ncbi:MAG TPA: alanine--tRNA ligase, partial [Acidilobales archaeon]|nr:alanine--tRNA ligase [Acidilobales archaeon]